MKKTVYFENLDGLRFLAFFSVFLFHGLYTKNSEITTNVFFAPIYDLSRYGWLGVNFFFVLSGFLITYLIHLEEKEKRVFSLGKFYIRRILRIWPLYYFIVAFCFIVYPILYRHFSHSVSEELPNILFFIFHLSNYSYIYNESQIPTLNILWSVSIEEQFYLFWPLILYFFKGKYRYIVIVILLIISIIFAILYHNNPHYYQHHLLFCMLDLIIGSTAALISLNYNGFTLFFKNLSKWTIGLVYLLIASYFSSMTYGLIDNIEIITAVLFLFIILEQNYSKNSFVKISRFRLISKLGKYTYGLYCYHYFSLLVAIRITKFLFGDTQTIYTFLLSNLLGLTISILVSIISYHIFEEKFLKLKYRFSIYTRPI